MRKNENDKEKASKWSMTYWTSSFPIKGDGKVHLINEGHFLA